MTIEALTLAPRLAFVLQYLGTAYAGWQAQDNALAIQTVVERALAAIHKCNISDVRLQGSARTDAGVHARMQVAHVDPPFRIEPERLLRAVNDRLPPDVRVVEIIEVGREFHALDSAIEKEYHYRLWVGGVRPPFLARTTGLGPQALDLDRLRAAAATMAGRRDFALVRKTGTTVRTTVRDLREVSIQGDGQAGEDRPTGGILTFVFRADGFLRGTVRLLVGTLVDVGRGKLPVEAPAALLRGDISLGRPGPSADAAGLFLWRVGYAEALGIEPPDLPLW